MPLLDSLKKKARTMGNTSSNRKGNKQVVTVLQADGRVLEFSRPVRVADLLLEHPGHFVCHSSALVLSNQGKMLPRSALLTRGDVYFLLPLPSSAPAQEQVSAPQAGTMKFVISKQQLAKILAEGNVKVVAKETAPVSSLQLMESQRPHVSVLHRPVPSLCPKRTVTWAPALASISEVPVM